MQRSSHAALVMPRYRASPKPRVYVATFPLSPTAPTLSVASSRARRYPGLGGDGPDTRAVYAGAAELLGSARHVVDFGCGSGMGAAELAGHFERVSAIDSDLGAVRFARAYLAQVPSVEVLHAPDGVSSEASSDHDAGYIIDVLGHLPAPVNLLRTARGWLGDEGRLFVAEPLAFPTQALLPPVLRAFSRPGLTQLLLRAGWEVERWVEGVGHFASCIARPIAHAGWNWLAQGDIERDRGHGDLALEAYSSALQHAPPALVSEALLGAAEVHASRGDLDEACRCLLEAARATPGHVRALAGLAELSLHAGDVRQGLSLAVRALECDPCDMVAVQSLARAADRLEQVDAFASFRIANGLAPADLSAAIELGRLSAARGELGYAIWLLERVREFRDDLVADFHVTLGWLYLGSGRLGEARLEAELGRVKEPQSSGVHELWARLEAEDSPVPGGEEACAS
jgi:tetratricopeptide (TPR) repeat protein